MASSAAQLPDREPARYQIKIQGKIRETWSAWLSGLEISTEPAGAETRITTLTGSVADQAALRGILCRLWDLNLTLISVCRIEMQSGERKGKK
jgi:hypothetical protein